MYLTGQLLASIALMRMTVVYGRIHTGTVVDIGSGTLVKRAAVYSRSTRKMLTGWSSWSVKIDEIYLSPLCLIQYIHWLTLKKKLFSTYCWQKYINNMTLLSRVNGLNLPSANVKTHTHNFIVY